MRHLKKFNESSDNKLELLRDVFENLEDEFDVDVEYTHSGVSIYNSNAKSVSVSIKLRDYITPVNTFWEMSDQQRSLWTQ
jgi:frataxin-like iron-binding protein CyaY